MDRCTKRWWHQKKSSQIPILISSISVSYFESHFLPFKITKIIVAEIWKEGYRHLQNICVGLGNMNEWKNIVHLVTWDKFQNLPNRKIQKYSSLVWNVLETGPKNWRLVNVRLKEYIFLKTFSLRKWGNTYIVLKILSTSTLCSQFNVGYYLDAQIVIEQN